MHIDGFFNVQIKTWMYSCIESTMKQQTLCFIEAWRNKLQDSPATASKCFLLENIV